VVLDLAGPKARRTTLPPLVAGLSCLGALLVILYAPFGREAALGGRFVSDAFSRFARALATGGGVAITLLSAGYTRRMDRGHGEFYGMLLLALCGVMLVSGVGDLMSLFVSLELLTITSYVLG